MKKLLIILLSFSFYAQAQEDNDTDAEKMDDAAINASFGLGDGLNFSFNNGDYRFKLSGFIQPSYRYSKFDTEGAEADNYFNSKRSYLTFSGTAAKEKISFMLQNDFSRANSLLDAWLAYSPWQNVRITAGQKLTFTNNREMTFYEDKLQFTDRGLFSTEFSNTGREFGIFIETKFGSSNFSVMPKVAITSGDGLNSFGSDSRDTDKGGLKWGGRLDILPLGDIKPGNDQQIADLGREDSLKILAGAAFSYNNGASNRVGEGHGDFMFYDYQRKEIYPDYTQIYADILFKYQGASLLAEYANASAGALEGSFTNAASTVLLYPGQISEFLVLGDAFNVQAGYVTKSGYAVDVRYESITPEFDSHPNTLITDTSAYTIGFTKYFRGNNLKLQAAYTSADWNGTKQNTGEIVLQVVF